MKKPAAKAPSARAILARLFGASAKGIANVKSVLTGYATVGGGTVCVIGTCDGTYIDNAAALRLAAHVIDCIERHPKTPIVMLVDSAGQEPNRLAEMLGLASYFGHLLSCLELARRKGHKLITVATGKAVGGAFICYGMFGDRIYALDSASVGLMPIEAMSAVTKIPVPVLKKLSKTMPSLEFGAQPFALLGGVEEVWSAKDDVPAKLARAIATSTPQDNRAELGKKRGGRKLALDIRKRVLAEIGAMIAFRRHALVWLSQAPDAETDADRERAASWQAARRPFVVTRRRGEGPDIGLGFCTTDPRHPELRPRRVAAQVDPRHVVDRARPPSLADIARCPAAGRHAPSFTRLIAAATGAGLDVRVYGSWMWQALTGERHVHESSDLDVLIDVPGMDAADRAAALFEREETHLPFKIDGELSFAGLGEVSWREYRGPAPEIVAKSIDSLRLIARTDLCR